MPALDVDFHDDRISMLYWYPCIKDLVVWVGRIGLKQINEYRSLIPVKKTYGHAREDDKHTELRENIEQALLLERMDIDVHSQGI